MAKRQSKKLPVAVELPSGSYRCQVMIDGKRLSFTADTAAEAQQQALLAKVGKAEKKTGNKKTVGQMLDDYIALRTPTLSPSTIRGYKMMRDNRMKSIMDTPLDKMTPQKWQQAINDEVKDGKNAKYVSNLWGLVRPALVMELGSAPTVSLPQVIRNEHPFLDDEQVKVFISAIRGDSCEMACLLALHSLRRSEIMALTWKDIDLKKLTISVNGAVVKDADGNKIHKKETKTAKSRRTIPIFIDRLTELLEENKSDPDAQVLNVNEGYLFKHINKICKKNNLPEIGIHGLRHTFASIAYFAGSDTKTIQELGGWSDPHVLDEIYTHVFDKARQETVTHLRTFYQS